MIISLERGICQKYWRESSGIKVHVYWSTVSLSEFEAIYRRKLWRVKHLGVSDVAIWHACMELVHVRPQNTFLKWCGMNCSTRKSIARLCSEDIAIRTRSIYVAVTMDFSFGLCDAVQCKEWIQLVAIITPSFSCVYLFSFDIWTA